MTTLGEMPRGPYMNEDGDWWVAVDEIGSFREARARVIQHLDYTIPEDGTLVYKGQEMAWLDSEHMAGCGPECPTNRNVLAYHFEENRRW